MTSSNGLYVITASGICNQLIPIITAMRVAQKTSRKLTIHTSPIQSYNGIIHPTTTYIHQLLSFPLNNVKFNVSSQLPNNTFVYNREAHCGGKDTILLEQHNKIPNIAFNKVVHCIGLHTDDLSNYIPYPQKYLANTHYTDELQTIAHSIKPNKDIQNKIDENTPAFKTLGIHYRTLDGGFTSNKDLFNTLLTKIDNFLIKNYDWHIYFSTDDVNYIAKIKTHFSSRAHKIHTLTSSFGSDDSDKVTSNENGLKNAIIELFILSKCDEFWGTAGSSFSFTAWLFSNRKSINYWNTSI